MQKEKEIDFAALEKRARDFAKVQRLVSLHFVCPWPQQACLELLRAVQKKADSAGVDYEKIAQPAGIQSVKPEQPPAAAGDVLVAHAYGWSSYLPGPNRAQVHPHAPCSWDLSYA